MNAIIVSALLGVVSMLAGIATHKKQLLQFVAIIGLAVLLLANIADTYNWFSIKVNTNNMLAFTKFGMFFNTLAISATLIYVLVSGNAITQVGNNVAEYFALIFFVLCGISILSAYNNLLMLFLGVEIMSIPLYILTGSAKTNLKSNEAALKYFLMGSFTTGIMLMGIALMYGASGSFGLNIVALEVAHTNQHFPILEMVGLLLVFVAMLFKVSAAPFHFWTPDVYDGAPSVFTSFMATIVKAAGFIAIINLFFIKSQELGNLWKIILPLVIIATLLFGNITAVFQQSVKRMLAYSSIAQAGFMLFALYAQNDVAKEGMLLYTAAYSLATIGIFAILVKIDDYTFEGFNGLAKTQPLLAATNTIFLLSLAGIPLTAGFFAKYFMLNAVLKTKAAFALPMVIIGVLFAAISVYYYFRLIQAMYFKEGNAQVKEVNTSYKLGLVLIAALIILLGVFPDSLLSYLYF
jgi:NADH-quinone oxidoreductase subunit N